jgi:putative endonuclease
MKVSVRSKPARRKERRTIAHLFGLRAERIAALWLNLKGYRVLARRYVVAGGEIDLVAMRGDTIAFVEVKARQALDEALIAITATKRGRLNRAVRHWLSHNHWAIGRTYRGDAIFIAPRRLPTHRVGAFELDIG